MKRILADGEESNLSKPFLGKEESALSEVWGAPPLRAASRKRWLKADNVRAARLWGSNPGATTYELGNPKQLM